MQLGGSTDTFSGEDFGEIFNPFHFESTSALEFAVDDDGAATALSGSATDFNTQQTEFFAQNTGESIIIVANDEFLYAVNF